MSVAGARRAHDRVPPHDLDAEASLLGAMLLARDAIVAAVELQLSAADFYKPAHGHIFDAITSIYARGEAADPVTVGDELRRAGLLESVGAGTLVALQANTPAIGSAGSYARIIAEHASRRRRIAACMSIIDADYECRPVDGMDLAALTPTPAAVGVPDEVRPGGAFIFDAPAVPPSLWGSGETVLWAAGEPLAIVGPPGVGKTTLGQQLAFARVGVGSSRVLEMEVVATERRLLYIAADRPSQAQRSFRRMVRDSDRAILDERLAVWRGPLPHDLGVRPETLAEVAQALGADTVVVDSLKDVAVGLAKDEIGSAVNQALQLAVAAGVEVLVLHHQRKGQQGGKPTKLEDVYGSTWITAGCGSVVLVWGEPGDPIVELTHLKQPAEQFGPAKVLHDHSTGTSRLVDTPDLLALVRAASAGVTAKDMAAVLFDTRHPEPKDVEKARRKLDTLVRDGLVHKQEGRRGGSDGGAQARYVAVTQRSEHPEDRSRKRSRGVDDRPDHDSITPSTLLDVAAGEGQ